MTQMGGIRLESDISVMSYCYWRRIVLTGTSRASSRTMVSGNDPNKYNGITIVSCLGKVGVYLITDG
jgi:hypothetical protein